MIVGVARPHTISIPPKRVLRVFAVNDQSEGHVDISTGRPDYVPIRRLPIDAGGVNFGPYDRQMRAQVTCDKGMLEYRFVSDFERSIEHGTNVIQSHRVIAEALNERATLQAQVEELQTKMALQDKFQNLAEKARSIPRKLGDMADASTARLDAAEKRGVAAQAKIDAVITDVEKGVSAVEDTANQMSNGAPADA